MPRKPFDVRAYTCPVLMLDLGADERLRLTDKSAVEGGRLADGMPTKRADAFRELVWCLVNEGCPVEEYSIVRHTVRTYGVKLAWNRYSEREDFSFPAVAMRHRSVLMFVTSVN